MKLLIVDLSHVFWSTALGGKLDNTNAARDTVVRSIRSLASGYDRVAIALDGKAQSFRAKACPSYKAGRAQRPENLWRLLDNTAEHLDAAGFHVFRAPYTEEDEGYTYEADDVIGTITKWAIEQKYYVDILSGDSDLTQLVDDALSVRLLRWYKGITYLTESGVQEWLNVRPNNVIELKALAGDGDGYKPFPGIADTTAIKMLDASGDALAAIEAILQSDKKTAIGEKIRSLGREKAIQQVELGYAMARLVCTVPLPLKQILQVKTPVATRDVAADFLPPEPEPVSDAEVIEDESVPQTTQQISTASTTLVLANPLDRMLMSPAEVRQRYQEFQALIKHVLVQNVDYGKIPGCGDKDALFKGGAEKLTEVYGFAPFFEIQKSIERFDELAPFVFYRVKCELRRKADGAHVAECVGSANSRETKWANRWMYDNQVPGHIDITRLRKKTFTARKGQNQGQEVTQYSVPNEQLFDQFNTILKMAQKRAFVGATVIATRSSGIFASDIDDLPPGAIGSVSQVPQWDSE